ncbi:enoyl-CoA hydratase-related protein [Nocardioides acrostichi]|uniref:Enoyl-CoA hydratase/isomerase family protein n=1 Tax=Nocardioides acrostichi TaxID=2784339 RepID=A0A930V2S6_9ACTN|nr:enoyl-CoA hydratase-related protein [Nocardioides acrostichi]MBF4162705.1 enoyl-CoA hydratase/isomerase family protein [Nocardioides acrostichi]
MAHVRVEVADHIATITLDRPEALNAFTDEMESELMTALDRCDADDDVRAVVLTGAGRAFCAGMDLSDADATFESWRTSDRAPSGSQYRVEGQRLPFRRDGGGRVVLRMFASDKPIIAAINGAAVGVGLTMTLAADIRVCADHATLGFVFNRRGLVPESCSSWFLPRLVPMSTALEWVLTGRLFDAHEALRHGLVRSLHPAAEILDAALGLAREIADNAAPVSVALARQLLWRMLGADHPMVAHEIETHALNVRGVSADAIEGIGSFLDHRAPRFADRVSVDLPAVFDHRPVEEFVARPGGAP